MPPNLSSLNSNGGNIDLIGSSNFTGQGLIQLDPGSTIAAGLGNLTITANRMSLGVNQVSLTGTGNLTLQPLSPNQPIVLGGIAASNPNSLELLTNDLNALQSGFNNITIGRSDGSGAITLAGDVNFNDPVTLRSPVGEGLISTTNTITAPSITLIAPESITAGRLTATNGDIVLSSNEINLLNPISSPGNLILQPTTPSQAIAIGGTDDSNPNSLDLTVNDLNALQDGVRALTIGAANGTGSINVAENTAFNASTTLRTPGGSIIFNGGVALPNDAALNLDSLSATTNLNQNITNTSSDPLSFFGNVSLNNDITITSASDIRFANTLDGDRQLVLNAANNVRFGGAVGGSTPLRGLSVSSPTTEVASNLTTSGDIQFNGAVNVRNNAAIKSNAGSINSTGTIAGINSAINLSTPAGRIAVQNLSAPGNPITVMARDSIKTGEIDSAEPQTNGGVVPLCKGWRKIEITCSQFALNLP